MAEFKVVNNRAYNAATKLFVKDSYPCDYVATFDNGQTVACHGSHARIIEVAYISFNESLPDFKNVRDINSNTAVEYSYDGHSYILPPGVKTIFASEDKLIAETDADYILLAANTVNHTVPHDTVMHNIQIYGFCEKLKLMLFRELKSDVIFYSSTNLPLTTNYHKIGNIYAISHPNENYYYLIKNNNSFTLVNTYEDISIDVLSNIDGAVTSEGIIKYVCKFTECIVKNEIKNIYEITLPHSNISFKLEFRMAKNFEDELIYSCGNKYFSFNEYYSTMIFAMK